MAIYNGRILMRKGNEADFDPSKLMSGEWAVSLDAGIVRICLEAGKVIRMATYEAFEEDMKQIEAILLECQSIEEAVRRINTEVSEKLNACAEYVQQAKNYSEQAKTSEANSKSYMQSAKTSEENAKVYETNAKASENSAKEYENSAKLTEERAREVFESIPEDYSTISNDLYELAIKETASGEEIHVNDSSNLKLREFALYGKAKQNTTTGKNLLPYPYTETTKTENGITFTVNEKDGSIKVIGTSTEIVFFELGSFVPEIGKTYTLNGLKGSGSSSKYMFYWNTNNEYVSDFGSGATVTITDNTTKSNKCLIVVYKGNTVDFTVYPMISVDGGEYEPYTNGATPRPDYPQPIEVSGASGSVAVKSCGKNLFDKNAPFLSGETFDDNGNQITSGTTDWGIHDQYIKVVPLSDYIISGNIVPLSWNLTVAFYDMNKNPITMQKIPNKTGNIILNIPQNIFYVRFRFNSAEINKDIIQMEKGIIVSPYEEYKETLATIPTENGLASVNDLRDAIIKYADGSGEKIKNTHYLEVTEEMISYTNYDTTYNRFNVGVLSEVSEFLPTTGNIQGFCNFAKVITNGSANAIHKNSVIIRKNGNYLNMYIWADGVTDKESFMSLNPKFLLGLSTPIETPLTAEEIAEIEKLHTFYPVTNISNDFDCGMSVTYYCDSKNYINNQLAIMKQEQEEAMTNMLLLMPTEVQAMMIENDTNDLLKESEI